MKNIKKGLCYFAIVAIVITIIIIIAMKDINTALQVLLVVLFALAFRANTK